MAEETPEAAQQQQVRVQALGQYIRDLSFENVVMQKGISAEEVQPDIQVQVSLDARTRDAEKTYEVITKFNVSSKNKANGDTLFLLELDYGGIFYIDGVAEEQLHPFLLIECPRLMFPFVRRVVSDITRDGGFPPLNIDNVDFLAMYQQEIERRMQAQQEPEQPTVN